MSVGVTAISVGPTHSCAIKNGGVWCWGSNTDGQLGNGTKIASQAPAPVTGLASGVTAIGTGEDDSCAIQNGAVWCWGDNEFGQLGTGNNTGPETCSSNISSHACSLSPVKLPTLANGVTAIGVGEYHTCALKDGGAWCWGGNDGGANGNGTTAGFTSPPVSVPGLTSGLSAISAGHDQTCALQNAYPYGVTCWGSNSSGQQGNNGDPNVPHGPAAVQGLPTYIPHEKVSVADLNGDGTISTIDVACELRLLIGLPCVNDSSGANAADLKGDANCDGVVDARDVVVVLGALSGIARQIEALSQICTGESSATDTGPPSGHGTGAADIVAAVDEKSWVRARAVGGWVTRSRW